MDRQDAESAVRVLSGYPTEEEVAALIAVLAVVGQAARAAPGPEAAGARPGRIPAAAFAAGYQSPTSWQAS
ncbi:hypothetical protein Caci_3542 [Catenulispora acidiphila DSM 44928]|uniref:Acyl-CoA carboxylase subunit epsilon n=1 Tax=Catenulispora acidiphila (strain DSM 44928 / JCM 14897 / NBRC 102108 / NRRL B-24433 / ID139908) TaxID=479433 RepID=C7QAE8_CATAD|nr:acyl-CoA carboxylase subunit epsilon [Catenulispora acidiphila]ACU72447.1 hypothetical protein Caci_3542 [Catenulispora acidiphila DSM 44928]